MNDHYIIADSKNWKPTRTTRIGVQTGQCFSQISSDTHLKLWHFYRGTGNHYPDGDRRNPRYIFFPHWSHIISAEIYETYECVMFHMTDLPYGRGGSPLQNLIARGHTETKLTAFKCVKEIDAGPIYLQRDLSLAGAAWEIYDRASDLIEDMIAEIVATNMIPVPQDGVPTFFKRRTPEQSKLDGRLSDRCTSKDIYDHIRMLDAPSYPHAFIEGNGIRCEFTDAQLTGDAVTAKVVITPCA
jgi:methionyl-tRNA formyltransferase